LKVASPQLIAKRSIRTGDGSRIFDPHISEPEVWEEKVVPVTKEEEWSWNEDKTE
jgi:hypothetical protein